MGEYTHRVVVKRPLEDVREHWRRMETFPHFMEGVEEVEQTARDRWHWKVSIAGVSREFDAEVVSSGDNHITWRSLDGPEQRGHVTFSPVDGGATSEVALSMSFEPSGFLETIGDDLGLVANRVKGDLERFKEHMEAPRTEAEARAETEEGPERVGLVYGIGLAGGPAGPAGEDYRDDRERSMRDGEDAGANDSGDDRDENRVAPSEPPRSSGIPPTM
jgi:hypothetical protein